MNRLVGKQDVDFKNDKGERISGIKLHFLCQDERVFGECAATQFIGVSHPCYDVACSMALGEFSFVYGPKGKIMEIVISPVKEEEDAPFR